MMSIEHEFITILLTFFELPYSYSSLLFLIILGTFISEDLLCLVIGFMVASLKIKFIPAVTICMIGIFIGDVIIYLLGKYFGRPVLKHQPFKWILKPYFLTKIEIWFKRHSTIVIFLCRFIPGTRLPVYFSAGMLNISFLKFSLSFFLSALIWFPLIIGLSSYLGQSIFSILNL